MCVILYKPKKTKLPKKEILKTCYINNYDGVGYTFTHNHNVIIKKGYFNFNKFYKDLIKDYNKFNLSEHNLIIHFRIGTSGGTTKEKTQPFKITNNIKELNKLYIKNNKTSLVHNGIFSNYTYNKNNSDTQNYIKDFMYPLLKSKIKNKNDIIKNNLSSSKIATLDKNDNVLLYGDFIKDNGIYYSNYSYNNYMYKSDSKKYNFNGDTFKEIESYQSKYYYKELWSNYYD